MAKKDTVERLAGGIARDFDHYLTTIIGHAETLGEYLSPGDPRAGDVAAICRAAERAFGLTQQLLAFSRTRGLRPKVADLNGIIGRLRYTLQRVAGDQIRVDMRLAPAAHRVRVDAEQLQQIVFNLALSARDAMPDGGVLAIATANVSIASDDPRAADVAPGDYIELSISDTGTPIDATVQPCLFDEFGAAGERRRGGGLGIALVYGVVEQGGGFITVDSPDNQPRGTRIIVLLPAVEEGALPAAEPRGGKRSGNETVVVAADDATVQGLIVAVLRRRGYGVLDAPDAWQALQLATGHDESIELLVTTATTNGRVIADAFRATRPETRVLFVGAPIDEHRERFANEAMLAQPFTPDALARRVRGVLAAARVHLEMRILPQ
jgi:CheY-like chemotaxis protein